MVTRIAPAPMPFPSPLFYRGGSTRSPLYSLGGGAGPASPGQDWLSRLTGGVQDNADALIGFGSGLLSSPTFAGGLAAGGQGWMAGNQADMSLRDRRKTDAASLADENQTKAWLAKNRPDLLNLPVNKAWDLATKTPAADSTPTAIQEYQYAVKQGFAGTFAEYETQMKRAGATNLTFNNDQANAATFADRMKAAEPILDSTEAIQGDLGQASTGLIPFGLGNYLQKPEYQQAIQAQRDFVNALLRKESGAAISEGEFENAKKQYFPQPGDSPEVVAQKRQNRAIAIAGMQRSGGPAYNNPSAPGNGASAPDAVSVPGGFQVLSVTP